MSKDKLAERLRADADHWRKLADQSERDGMLTAADAYRVCADQLSAALEAEAKPAEPLFLLHTGQIDSDGEQDEWDCEADSGKRVAEFCRLHPGQTVKLYAAPAAPAPVPDTKDAERLRYLLSDDGDWTLCEWDHDAGYWVSDQREPDVVRAAIDAAIAASKGGAA